MGNQNKYYVWGSSLSLKPLNINIDDKKIICKREANLSGDEKSPKMHKPDNNNNKLMTMPKIMEMDIKQALVIDLEEVEMSKDGSLNSALSSSANGKGLGGFRGDRDIASDDEGGSGGGGGDRKKLRLAKEQITVLEQAFKEHTTLNTRQKLALARQVNLKPRQVEVWFQNRRARTKLKQTEVDCEYLRRFCETLTEQNRNLQKEVHELRALKGVSSDQFVVHGKNNHPGTTLNLCPSCKSVSVSSSVATTSKSPTIEKGCYQAGVLHRPVPLNLKKPSLSINNNRMIESHLPRS